MKKIALSIVLASTLLIASDNTKDCIENFQNDILNIINTDKPSNEKEQAIKDIYKSINEECDTVPKATKEAEAPKYEKNTRDCVEEFENDIMKILLSKPEPEEKKKAIKDIYKSYEEKCEGKF
jgi:hypothetical protein